MNFLAQLRKIKELHEDFEFYPTTDEILKKLGNSLKNDTENRYKRYNKFLDIGAGGGKVLDFVSTLEVFRDYYAIEKSQFHLSNLKPEYYILGVDFWNTTLLDKEVDVIFSNPPYSEFEEWTVKIIKESPSNSKVFLVLPERWKDNQKIQDQIKARNAETKIHGSFSFENAEDRTARAKVNLIEIEFSQSTNEDGEKNDDPFLRFFNENFKYPEPKQEFDFVKEVENTKLINKVNLIEALCLLYDNRMEELRKNYTAICQLDADLLKEFEISRNSLIASLKMKLQTTKKQFWQRLFDGTKAINKVLTHESRRKIYEVMNAHTGIEFNRENCYAVVLWIIKNSNNYFDQQFIDTYEKLIEHANVENYKSNQRVFQANQFRYTYYSYNKDEKPTHVKLKIGHRIVASHCGGLNSYNNGLEERAANFIGDLMVLANNFGFVSTREIPHQREWTTSKAQYFDCKHKGETVSLFKVRAYHNGNLHFQFNPEFIHVMNILHGRLKGWLNTTQEAEEEIQAPKDLTEQYFDYKFRIENNQLLLT